MSRFDTKNIFTLTQKCSSISLSVYKWIMALAQCLQEHQQKVFNRISLCPVL